MEDCWVVLDKRTGKTICQCASINDAIMMVSFSPHYRSYSRKKFLIDQIVDITSTTDKQLPTNDIVVCKKGSKKQLKKYQMKLTKSELEAFNP